jgi:hypothetical protein
MVRRCAKTGTGRALALGLLCLLLSTSGVCGGEPVLTGILHRWRLDGNTLDAAGSQALSWDSGTADPVPAAYEGLQRNSLAAASLTQTGHLVVDLNPGGPTYDREGEFQPYLIFSLPHIRLCRCNLQPSLPSRPISRDFSRCHRNGMGAVFFHCRSRAR